MWTQVEHIMQEATSRIVQRIAAFIPGLVAALVFIMAAIVLAVVARTLTVRALRGMQFDRRAPQWGLGMLAEWSPARSASAFVGRAVQWTVLLAGLLVALTALDAAMPLRLALSIFEYVPHVLAAAVILALGFVLAQFFARAVLIGAVNMQIQAARELSLAVKWLVIIVAASMALEQLQIGRQILVLAFGILFGGIVLATALAVGLGARDIVGRVLDRWFRRRPDGEPDHLDHV
jgi:hypothetical protein